MRRAAVLAVAAAIGALLSAPFAEAEGTGRIFGLNYSFHDPSGKDARKLKKSGARTVRWMFSWPAIEQGSQGNFNWSGPDKLVGALASKRIQVLPIMWGSPKWVAERPAAPPVGSEREREAWKAFLRAAVNRYGPDGTFWSGQYRTDHPGKAALPIKVWQIWNEPNVQSAMRPPDPDTYARLLKLSDRAIEDADPRAKVMLAGMPGYSGNGDAWDFIRRLYKKGAKKNFDIAALHPYARTVRQMLGEIKRVRRAMRKHGDRRTALWMTEIGWGSLPKNATPYGQTKGKQGQKRILKRSFRALKKERHHWHIKRVLWFNFRDPKGGSVEHCSFCSSAGLLTHDYSAKPSWRAFRAFTH
jgi:polysaccharide biosynthesis protein PslG